LTESREPGRVPGESRPRAADVSDGRHGHHRTPQAGGEVTRQLALIHLGGNALLLLLVYYWLGIGESRAATLAWSVLVLVVFLCLACILHGASFLVLGGAGLRPALRTSGRNLLPILVVVFAALAIYLLLAQWADYSQQPAFRIASWLTLKLRRPVKPAAVL